MTRATDHRGFTLIELLVTMTLGFGVIAVVFTLLVSTGNATKRVSDRVDSSQRGRTAIEQMTQQLRAMVCMPGGVPPVVSADGQQVTWYANLDSDTDLDGSDADSDPTYDPELRRLSLVGWPETGGVPARIVEERWSAHPLPATPAARPPDRTRVLIDRIAPTAGTGVFRYGGYVNPTDVALTPLDPVTDPARVLQVEIAFLTRPTDVSDDARTTLVTRGAVYARTIDRSVNPGKPNPTFACTI